MIIAKILNADEEQEYYRGTTRMGEVVSVVTKIFRR